VIAVVLGVRADECARLLRQGSFGFDGKDDVVSDEHAPCLLFEFGDDTELASGEGSACGERGAGFPCASVMEPAKRTVSGTGFVTPRAVRLPRTRHSPRGGSMTPVLR
jgi:hypothetical protein